jgi:large conductance mechanosensitive channel
MLKDFRTFVLKGNVVDLAVAVVIGAAFGAVVTALVKDLVTPVIGAIGGKADFSRLAFTINGSRFMYGDFINAVVSFLIIAAVIFFFVVQPLNKLQAFSTRSKVSEAPTDRKCPECLSEVPKGASRCRFCTAKLTPQA